MCLREEEVALRAVHTGHTWLLGAKTREGFAAIHSSKSRTPVPQERPPGLPARRS